MLSNILIPCHLLPLFPSIFPSIRVFSSESALESGGQSIAASVLPMNIQSWFPLGLIGLISFQFKGLSRVFSNTTIQKHHSSVLTLPYGPTLTFIHEYKSPGKTITLTVWTFVDKVMSLLFNMLSRFVIAFFPRRKRLLISWPQSPSTVILEPKKMKSVTVSTFPLLFAVKW